MYISEEDKEYIEWLNEVYEDIYTSEELRELFYENRTFTNY